MLTQIIAGDSLQTLGRKAHESRTLWGITSNCDCPLSKTSSAPIKPISNGIAKVSIIHYLYVFNFFLCSHKL